ncbi:MAG: hypothetical protein ACPLRZ_01140 [Thermovenabulum sp.]|uniref:hypothetical protein n=1 Tax=Thermovenabulum sp. TaxID=3100335 RepID=UPI003C7C5964
MKPSKTLRVFFYLFIFSLLILCIINGCSKGQEKSSPNSGSEKSNKVDNLLRKLEEEVNSLITDLEGEFFKKIIPAEQGQQSQSKQGQQGSNKDKEQSKESQGQSKQGQGGGGQKQEPDWEKFEKKVTVIHNIWDDFRGEAAMQGFGEEELDTFNDKLNQLTMMFTQKDLYGAIVSTNDLYGILLRYYKDPKEKTAGPAKKTLFYVRSATYRGLKGSFEESQKDLLEAVKSWEYAKAVVEDPVLNKKTEFTIKDLIEALKARDPNLIKIKFMIAQKNLEKAIEKAEKAKS